MRGTHFLFTSRAFVKLTQDFKVDSETILIRVFNKKWSRWQNLRSRRRDTERRRRRELLGGSGGMFPRKILKILVS